VVKGLILMAVEIFGEEVDLKTLILNV